jgi:hypothetical protein
MAEMNNKNLSFDEDGALEFMEEMMQLGDLSLRSILENHPELSKQLAEVNLPSALALAGGLETIPQLQRLGVRLSVLIHLAVACCCGTRDAEASDLVGWLKLLDESPTALQEDPSEDVFVGYVCSSEGGFRVFPGIISHADFIVERVISFLIEGRDFPTFEDTLGSILAVLKLSESISEELCQDRYFSSAETPQDEILQIDEQKAKAHAMAVVFDSARLLSLEIDSTQLEPFLLPAATIKNLDNQHLQGSSVERFPLYKSEDTIVVSSPALLCRAIVRFFLERVKTMGGWGDTFWEIRSAEYFLNEVLSPLGVKQLSTDLLPKVDSELPHLFPYVGQFDAGMTIIGLSLVDSLSLGSDLEEFNELSMAVSLGLAEYINECCSALEKLPGFKGGLVLISLSGLGRPFGVGLHEPRPAWDVFSSPLADWKTLAKSGEIDARRLWYLSLQQKMAEEGGIRFQNMSGLLNLYGYWKTHDFNLIRPEMNLSGANQVLALDGSFSRTINTKFKNVSDRHCRWYPIEKRNIEIERDGRGLNPDVTQNLRYGALESARQGFLRGGVAKGKSIWWIELAEMPDNRVASDLVYRLWDCLMSWCHLLMRHLYIENSKWIEDELVILLNLPGVEKWNLDKIPKGNNSKPGSLSCKRDKHNGVIQITLKEEFLANFYTPKNSAERAILDAVVKVMVPKATPDEQRICVQEVMKSEDTRFFHIIQVQDLEGALAKGPAEPLLIPDEEFWRASIGLAFTVSKSPPTKIEDREELVQFLGKVVKKLQEKIALNLSAFTPLSVVSHAFSQLDEISRDRSRWDLSMRALLSLENQADWLQEKLRDTYSMNVSAEITNRILIETACYSCRSTGSQIVSQTELLSLQAMIKVMIQLAEFREAVVNNLATPRATIHSNGQIEFSDAFRDDVMQPYLVSRLDDGIKHLVDYYDELFEAASESSPRNTEDKAALKRFEEAFHSEFGIDLDRFNKITEEFASYATRSGQTGGILDEPSLLAMLIHAVGLTEFQAKRVLERFVLPMRKAWNKDLPNRYKDNDVFPWRFFRSLSVLVRPFVEVSQSPRIFAISATHLDRWRTYLVRSICNAELPDQFFESKEMKSFIRNITRKNGSDFEKRVAQEFENCGYTVRHSIKMRELGKKDADPSNDIDVIAWNEELSLGFMIECKGLKRALTVAQAIQQLSKFRGDPGSKKDYLTKHINRVSWNMENSGGLVKLTKIPFGELTWSSLLVTSNRVPMSFVDGVNYSKDLIWSFSEIREKLS